MILRVPDFYDSFHCIAGKCTDTCCIGWEIDIDDESAKRYSRIPGEFGDTLRRNIEDGHFKLREGDRCPFLRNDGLCDMICHLGEDSLCDICREHPRFVEVYGDIMEKGIGLCCEEGVRLLLDASGNEDSPIAFTEREIDDEPDDIPDDAREARDAIFEERAHLFKILADHTRPLKKRLAEIIDYAVETSGFEFEETGSQKNSAKSNENQTNKIHNAWINVLGKGESYGPAWDKAYQVLLQKSWAPAKLQTSARGSISSETASVDTASDSIFTDRDGEKIIAYLLFRYYEKSLFDGNSLTKVEFAVYFWIMVQKLEGSKINAIKLLSKQTEYSEEIMEILETEFMGNWAFSPRNFKQLLEE